MKCLKIRSRFGVSRWFREKAFFALYIRPVLFRMPGPNVDEYRRRGTGNGVSAEMTAK